MSWITKILKNGTLKDEWKFGALISEYSIEAEVITLYTKIPLSDYDNLELYITFEDDIYLRISDERMCYRIFEQKYKKEDIEKFVGINNLQYSSHSIYFLIRDIDSLIEALNNFLNYVLDVRQVDFYHLVNVTLEKETAEIYKEFRVIYHENNRNTDPFDFFKTDSIKNIIRYKKAYCHIKDEFEDQHFTSCCSGYLDYFEVALDKPVFGAELRAIYNDGNVLQIPVTFVTGKRIIAKGIDVNNVKEIVVDVVHAFQLNYDITNPLFKNSEIYYNDYERYVDFSSEFNFNDYVLFMIDGEDSASIKMLNAGDSKVSKTSSGIFLIEKKGHSVNVEVAEIEEKHRLHVKYINVPMNETTEQYFYQNEIRKVFPGRIRTHALKEVRILNKNLDYTFSNTSDVVPEYAGKILSFHMPNEDVEVEVEYILDDSTNKIVFDLSPIKDEVFKKGIDGDNYPKIEFGLYDEKGQKVDEIKDGENYQFYPGENLYFVIPYKLKVYCLRAKVCYTDGTEDIFFPTFSALTYKDKAKEEIYRQDFHYSFRVQKKDAVITFIVDKY